MKKLKLPKWLNQFLSSLAKRPKAERVGIGIISSLVGLAIIYAVFALSYTGKVYPHVTVGGVSFGGLSYNETLNKLNNLIDDNVQPVVLHYQDKTQDLDQSEIDWHYNAKQTAKDIYDIGRGSHNKLLNFWQQLRSPFSSQQIEPVVSYDNDALDITISTFADVVDQPAVDASAKYVGSDLITKQEQVGKTINRDEVRQNIIDTWSKFRSYDIVIQAYFDAPKIVLANEEELKSQAEVLAERHLTITYLGKTRLLNKNQIRSLIGFVGEVPESPVTDEGKHQEILTARFTTESAKGFLQRIAKNIDKPAVEPRLEIKNDKLVVAVASKNGLVVNVAVSAKDVAKALNGTEASPVVALTMTEQEPVINEDNLSKLGIKERIGYGQTSFFGSPSNRIHNIETGVSFLQSALVAPGQEFSTVSTLGAVDNTTGYLPELVIKENRTVPEFGGGLCQVSTTLFRSVLNAGLKVTERQNHSYRVSYYEPPVGLDATIYLPKPDFRFLNDTPAYVLIQGRVVGNSVIFELWGTSDGRVSTVSDPKILSTTKPGQPIKVKTDTLPKGEEKIVEHAHDGAVAIATYTVKRDGKIINQQTFKSIYKAWPERILIGTNPDLPPSGG